MTIRYLSDVGYSLFLIWTIETHPTVCRTKSVGFVLSGISIGSSLAYIVRSYPIVQASLGIVISLLVLAFSHNLRLDYDHRLMDTLSNNGYDRYD